MMKPFFSMSARFLAICRRSSVRFFCFPGDSSETSPGRDALSVKTTSGIVLESANAGCTTHIALMRTVNSEVLPLYFIFITLLARLLGHFGRRDHFNELTARAAILH